MLFYIKYIMNWFSCKLFKVLDKAEYLRDMEANLLPGFLRLQELVSNIQSGFPSIDHMFPPQYVVMIKVQSFPIVVLIYDLVDLINYFSFHL